MLKIQKNKPSLFDAFKSVAAAMIGVQKDENRVRDFEQGNPTVYIIIGIIFILLFLGTIGLIVSLVLSQPVS
jgi:uncharacterized MAPEG superfamily protein